MAANSGKENPEGRVTVTATTSRSHAVRNRKPSARNFWTLNRARSTKSRFGTVAQAVGANLPEVEVEVGSDTRRRPFVTGEGHVSEPPGGITLGVDRVVLYTPAHRAFDTLSFDKGGQ